MAKPAKTKSNTPSGLATEGPDLLYGGNGDDSRGGGFGNDTMFGGNGNDVLIGGQLGALFIPHDDDYLDGGNGNDTLRGGHGNDTLVGGNGDDLLNGEAGANLLTGGNGDDIFRFGYSAPRLPIVGMGSDTITDFGKGNDIIDLRPINSTGNFTDETFVFIGQQAFSGGDTPELRYRYQNGNTIIELDTMDRFREPDGVVDFTITLWGIHVLTEDQFLL